MFDLGFGELLLIGIVALIVVGPNDLPGMFRSAGRFMGKARGMAREFSRAMESAADEAGLKEVQSTLKAAANPKSFATDAIKKAATPAPGSAAKTPEPGSETEKLARQKADFKAQMDAKADAIRAEKVARAAAEAGPEADAAPEPGPGPAPEPAPAPEAAAPATDTKGDA